MIRGGNVVLQTWSRYSCALRLARMSSQARGSTDHPSPAHDRARPKGEVLMNVFDRKTKRLQRDRITTLKNYKAYDFLKEEIGYRTADRILDVNRKFDTVVELGCGRGYVGRHILKDTANTIYQTELSHKLLMQSEVSPEVPTHRIVADEEFFPFKENSLDLVVSSLSLHWVNDLPGCFRQVMNALKRDGAFIGCMFGGDTLYELRVALQLAEMEREGGFSAHVSPFTDVQDLGNLLSRAGYAMITIDVDDIKVMYPSIFELMDDLKGMAENNCAWNRKAALHRDTQKAAAAIYKERYGNEEEIPATFQTINFIGWKPDPSQPKAAKRGSGEVSLKDLDRLDQLSKELQELRDKQNNPDKS